MASPATSSPPPSSSQSFEEKRYSLWLIKTKNENINKNKNVPFQAKYEDKNKAVKKTVKRVVKKVVKKVVVKKKVKKESGLLEFDRNSNNDHNIVSCSDELLDPESVFVTDVNSNAKDTIRVVKKEENDAESGLFEFVRNKNHNIVMCPDGEFLYPKTDIVTDFDGVMEDTIRVAKKEDSDGRFGLLEFETNKNLVLCSNEVRTPNRNAVNNIKRGMNRAKREEKDVKLGRGGDADTESPGNTVSSSNEVESPDYEIINNFTANKEDKMRVNKGAKRVKREENDGELGSGRVSTEAEIEIGNMVEFQNPGSDFDYNSREYDLKSPTRLQREECREESGKMEVDNEAKHDYSKISVIRAIEIVQSLSSDDGVSSASMSIESDNGASGKVAVEHVKVDTSTINRDEKKVRVVKKNVVTKKPKKVKGEEIPYTLEFRNPNADIANSRVPNLSADKNTGSNVDDMETENENSFHDASDNVNCIANKEENNAMVEKLGCEGRERMEHGFMMSDDMVLSAEMEALERRKRRKTQIFLGGLDKDAVEEDVRKVFQEIGEIVEVTVKMNERNGKNKGFAFLRYASAADAKKAVEKSGKIEIFGKKCSVEFMKGNDTIYLGNIDKTWKNEDIFKLLQDAGVDKIDKVTIKPDPEKPECNVGYAFLELETIRDAKITFGLLEKRGFLGNKKIRVEWAKQLSEADEEEMYKVKTVYAEYLPVSWDEEAVKDYFKKFGDIENVVLARNLVTYKRKDFAFVNYKSREAALACIKAFTHDSSQNENSKIKVHFAKSTLKSKQVKHACYPVLNTCSLEKPKAAQTVVHSIQKRSKTLSANHFYDSNRIVVQPHIGNKGESTSDLCENSQSTTSTNDELVLLLREQASWRQPQISLAVGSTGLNFTNSLPTRKRQYSLRDPNYSDIRGLPRPRTDISLLNPSVIYPDVEVQSLPHYHRQGLSYPSGLPYGVDSFLDSSQSQTRDASPGGGSGVF